jgi:hypothetical protein
VGLFGGDADCSERFQNGIALYFQFTRQIIDSNFTHPSLFVLRTLRLTFHIGLGNAVDASASTVIARYKSVHY